MGETGVWPVGEMEEVVLPGFRRWSDEGVRGDLKASSSVNMCIYMHIEMGAIKGFAV